MKSWFKSDPIKFGEGSRQTVESEQWISEAPPGTWTLGSHPTFTPIRTVWLIAFFKIKIYPGKVHDWTLWIYHNLPYLISCSVLSSYFPSEWSEQSLLGIHELSSVYFKYNFLNNFQPLQDGGNFIYDKIWLIIVDNFRFKNSFLK